MSRLPCYWRDGEPSVSEAPSGPPSEPAKGGEPVIVVMEEVLVSAPYDAKSCRASTRGDGALLDRVRKVLDCEWRRLDFK